MDTIESLQAQLVLCQRLSETRKESLNRLLQENFILRKQRELYKRVAQTRKEKNERLRAALQIVIARLEEGMTGKTKTLFQYGGDPSIVQLAKDALDN